MDEDYMDPRMEEAFNKANAILRKGGSLRQVEEMLTNEYKNDPVVGPQIRAIMAVLEDDPARRR